MKYGIGLAVVTVAALALGATAIADTSADAQKSVDQRVAAMKQMGGKVNEAFQLIDTDAAGAHEKLAIAQKIAESIPSMFPKGTGDGDPGVTSSRALPKIWSDQAGFQKAADGLVAAMKVADAKLAAKDAVGATAAFGDLRKACGTCHDGYRGPSK